MSSGLDFADVRLAHDPRQLRRTRQRSRLVRVSVLLLALLGVWSWLSGEIAVADLFSARRAENLRRFVREDLVPHELAGGGFDLGAWAAWALELVRGRGWQGLLATLAISVLAIVLAGLAGLGASFLGARNVMGPSPFEARSSGGRRGRDGAGRALAALGALVRGLLVLLRAIPEYVWAFLLLAMLGPSAWPAVLALAIHNGGILGKLGAETVENLDARPLAAWRGLGATRAQVSVGAALPLSLNRFLLYFFYRLETCVREATVLGMLGVVSLGYWIQDARAKQFYDEVIVFVALGALLVAVADVSSALVRSALRRAV
jgi:phosphonate transport system permease protein